MERLILNGKIEEDYSPDGWAVCVGGVALASAVAEWAGRQVHAVYVFAKEPINPHEAALWRLLTAIGVADAALYQETYMISEVTAESETTQEATVGGHDLLAAFRAHEGEYGLLVVQEGPIELFSLPSPA